MGRAVAEVLPFAIGVAISPIPIIAAILVVFSKRAGANGPAYIVGAVVSAAAVSTAVFLVASSGDTAEEDTGASDTALWVKLVLGLLLVVLAVKKWRTPASPDTEAPKWMGSIESLSPVKAGGLALLVCGLNPKNLMLSAGAGISLAQAGSSDGEAALGLIVFVLIGVSGVATPVIYSLTGGERAADVLDGWKAWLSTHNDAVMAVLFLVFGAVLFSQGLRGLTA